MTHVCKLCKLLLTFVFSNRGSSVWATVKLMLISCTPLLFPFLSLFFDIFLISLISHPHLTHNLLFLSCFFCISLGYGKTVWDQIFLLSNKKCFASVFIVFVYLFVYLFFYCVLFAGKLVGSEQYRCHLSRLLLLFLYTSSCLSGSPSCQYLAVHLCVIDQLFLFTVSCSLAKSCLSAYFWGSHSHPFCFVLICS